ncbi:hypothetical protein, partial [Pseudomonas sp.]|uniref:hypothetical protein n=1 Tax=Pseudomonas sp. TaxID=306 RepID=UPI0035650AAD
FSREFFAAQQSFAAKAAPTTAGSLQFAARQRGVWTTGDLLSNNPYIIDFMDYCFFVGAAGRRSALAANSSRHS